MFDSVLLQWLVGMLAVLAVPLCVVLIVFYLSAQRRAEQLGMRNANLLREVVRQQTEVDDSGRRAEWYRTLFHRTENMFFVYQLDADGLPGRFLEVNDAACALLDVTRERLLTLTMLDLEAGQAVSGTKGYTKEELVTLSARDLLHRERTAAIREVVQELQAKRSVRYERSFVGRDAKEFPVEIHAFLLEIQGKPLVMAMARDITEWQAARRALRDSEQRFRDFFGQSPLGVALYDANRRMLDVNRAALMMLGISDREQFAAMDLFVPPFLPESLQPVFGKGETVRGEVPLDFDEIQRQERFPTTRTGMAHLDILVNNLGLDRNYKPKGYLILIQDITERRKAELALRENERYLRQAQKMEAMGTLAGGIAHDFNNILTPIIGYAEMALRTNPPGGTMLQYMTEILIGSNRAKDMIRQILTFSRQTEQEHKPMHIIPVVKEALKLLRAGLPKTIEIRTSFTTDRDIVMSDPTQIHQVMMNLCTNAAHAMRELPAGVLDVQVSSCLPDARMRRQNPHLASGTFLRLSVRDTGSGIPPAVLDRIFEPFFTTKKSGEGTGMGLAVVHGVVTAMKGAISVESQVGKGTVFHLVLPTIEDESEAQVEIDTTPLPTGKGCVLFVDTERDIGQMAGHMLTALGYQPALASENGEALRLFQGNPDYFFAVVMDQGMLEMGGVELAKEIHSLRPDTPILLCSGYSQKLDPARLSALGIRDVLAKPIDMKLLAEALHRLRPGA